MVREAMLLLMLVQYGTWIQVAVAAPKGRRVKFGEGIATVLTNVPEVVELLNGKTSLGSMSWTQINSLVKGVMNQVERIGEEVEETKNEVMHHGMAYIVTVVTLSLIVTATLLLICLHSAKIKMLIGRARQGIPSNLEGIRRNMQEFVKIRKMSVGDIENSPPPPTATSPVPPPGYHPANGPYYGPLMPSHLPYGYVMQHEAPPPVASQTVAPNVNPTK